MQMSHNKHLPYGDMAIIAMKGCEEIAKRVSDQILECRAQFENASESNLHLKGYHRDSYIIKANFPRFATGEGKAVITESIRGYDLFIITDCFNYNGFTRAGFTCECRKAFSKVEVSPTNDSYVFNM